MEVALAFTCPVISEGATMFRISLRELFAFFAVIALVIVALRSDLLIWQGIIGLIAMLAIGLALIAGIFDRGSRHAFAIGTSVLMCGYAALLPLFVDNAYDSTLPTSALLISIHPYIAASGWADTTTGAFVPPTRNCR